MNKLLCYKKHGRIYIPKKQVPKKSKVLKKMGVRKNTFAGNMISRMYDYYFDGILNFKNEYKKYYRKEYDSLEHFIEEHFNIDHDEAKYLAEHDYSMKEYSFRSIERNIETLNDDEKFRSIFSDVIGGLDDEDQNGVYY